MSIANDQDTVALVIVAVAIVLVLFAKPILQQFKAMGIVTLCVAGVTVVGLIAFGLWRQQEEGVPAGVTVREGLVVIRRYLAVLVQGAVELLRGN